MRRGLWYGAIAFTLFGFFPLYWKAFEGIPALQTVAHRIFWSNVVLVAFIAAKGELAQFQIAIRSPRAVRLYATAGIVMAINWFIYIWAVNAGFVVQTALGYFINPLVSVLLGVIVLRERLRPFQWVAIALAATGVTYLALYYGTQPWIALSLGCTFGTYGFLKKTAPLDAPHGLALETSFLCVPALAFLMFENHAGRGAFGHTGIWMTLLMLGAGPVTTIPLLFFASAARRIPLSTMGMLQYINPTIQFLLGVFLYKEPFSRGQAAGFACVWVALAIYTLASRPGVQPAPGV